MTAQTVVLFAGDDAPRNPKELAMVTETNISQFKNWLNSASPDDLVTIAPTFFSRFGTLDQSHQQRLIQEIKQHPQAMSAFEKLPAFNQL